MTNDILLAVFKSFLKYILHVVNDGSHYQIQLGNIQHKARAYLEWLEGKSNE